MKFKVVKARSKAGGVKGWLLTVEGCSRCIPFNFKKTALKAASNTGLSAFISVPLYNYEIEPKEVA